MKPHCHIANSTLTTSNGQLHYCEPPNVGCVVLQRKWLAHYSKQFIACHKEVFAECIVNT